ncbi:hypothetical protein SAMN05660971_03957 [Halomonas cupida]|uniref:Uncharacterized protein n=1 Tax=Halomonas cupida TaxID=44933 RepID=A0A1M7LVA8_9GAMM|nr:hypothetical protein SAMN05660971_03957 [Halomonas cupida]
MSDDNPIKRWTAKRKGTSSRARSRPLRWLASTISPSPRSRAGLMKPSAAWRTGSRPAGRASVSELRETKEALGEAHLLIYA